MLILLFTSSEVNKLPEQFNSIKLILFDTSSEEIRLSEQSIFSRRILFETSKLVINPCHKLISISCVLLLISIPVKLFISQLKYLSAVFAEISKEDIDVSFKTKPCILTKLSKPVKSVINEGRGIVNVSVKARSQMLHPE
jgi:hypothetical protein